jgi:alpha-L-fucosidase
MPIIARAIISVMGDNGIPVIGFSRDWETPMTLNDTWGYSKTNKNWKSPENVISILTDVVGKGGNLLLNIGPDSLGNIPKRSLDILQTVGSRLKDNGESIYESTAAPDFPISLPGEALPIRKTPSLLHMKFVW